MEITPVFEENSNENKAQFSLASLEEDYSLSSLNSIIYVKLSFDNFLKNSSLNEISEQSIDEFLKWGQTKWAHQTMNSYIWALEAICHHHHSITTIDQVKRLDLYFKKLRKNHYTRPDLRINQYQYLKRADIEHIIQEISKKGLRQAQTALIIQSLFETACRASELCGIRHNDISNLGNKYLVVNIRGKRSKERRVNLSSSTYEQAKYTFPASDFVFPNERGSQLTRHALFNRIKRTFLQFSFNIHPHSLRHSKAMDLINRGVSVKAIAEYLGHSCPSTTFKQYDHSLPDARIVIENVRQE